MGQIPKPDSIVNHWAHSSLDILADHIECMAAAYLSRTNIPPDRVVLVQQNTGNEIRYWFEERKG